MREYRLYFNDNAGAAVKATVQGIVTGYTPGYTLFGGQGCWEQTTKRAYCLVIVEDNNFIGSARAIAERLRTNFGQECVMLTCHNINVEFIAEGGIDA